MQRNHTRFYVAFDKKCNRNKNKFIIFKLLLDLIDPKYRLIENKITFNLIPIQY